LSLLIFEAMKATPALYLFVCLLSCGSSTTEEEAMKTEIENARRAYEGARQEFFLKRDSAKQYDLSADTAFQARLKAAEARSIALRQEAGKKKREFRSRKQATDPRPTSPNTQ